jgi:hypothetical protein
LFQVPHVVTGERDMLPGNRRKMLQILIRDYLSLLPKEGYGFGKVAQ